jgi:oxygen-independent coproporphyrinogen-3 oxidase
MTPISAIKVAGAEEELSILMPTHGKEDCSLYFHIPFCTKKCDYCHFFVLPNSLENHQRLLNGLKLEWDKRKHLTANKSIQSVYFGGGTPSLLSPQALREILSWLPLSGDIEITLEANPETLSSDLLQQFRALGINRLSIGAQSFDDELLRSLGRTHSSGMTLQALEWAAHAGFDNISIDLMYDLPHQTLSLWEKTLTTAVKLPITHLSLYNLTIEPETLFFKKRAQLRPSIPDPETSLAMYQMAQEKLSHAGLIPYEISAFAKKDFLSRHNMGYWTARPFLGLGPSAYSFWDQVRFRNVAHLNKYLEALEKDQDLVDINDILSLNARRRELLAVELRLRRGVCISTFEKRHGPLEQDTREILKTLVQRGWVQITDDLLHLTSQGILFYDSVAEELI